MIISATNRLRPKAMRKKPSKLTSNVYHRFKDLKNYEDEPSAETAKITNTKKKNSEIQKTKMSKNFHENQIQISSISGHISENR